LFWVRFWLGVLWCLSVIVTVWMIMYSFEKRLMKNFEPLLCVGGRIRKLVVCSVILDSDFYCLLEVLNERWVASTSKKSRLKLWSINNDSLPDMVIVLWRINFKCIPCMKEYCYRQSCYPCLVAETNSV